MLSLIVVLLIAGLCLFLAEVLVPGWVLGIIGGMVMVAAIVLIYLQYGLAIGTMAFCLIGVAGVGGFMLWLRYFPSSPVGKMLVNRSTTAPPVMEAAGDLRPGTEGVALTDLRPAGTARFGTRRVDVVSEAVFISKDEPVCVTVIEGARVVVRQVSNFSADQKTP